MAITLNNSYYFSTSNNNIMQNQSRAGMVFKMRINSLQGNTIPNETGFLARTIFGFWHYFNPSGNTAANVELSFGPGIRIGSVSLTNGVVFSIGLSYDGIAGHQKYYINAIPTVLGSFVGNTADRVDPMTLGVSPSGCIINLTVDDIFVWNGYTPSSADISAIVNGTDPATIGLTATTRFRWTLNGTTGQTPHIGDAGLQNVYGTSSDGTNFATTNGTGSAIYADPLVWTPSVDIDNAYVATSGKTVVSFFTSLITGLRTTPNAVYTAPHLVVNGVDKGALEKLWFSGYMPFVFYSTPGSYQVQTTDAVALIAPVGWANTPVGGTASLDHRPIDNRTQRSSIGSDKITRTMKIGTNNSDPTATGILGMYSPLKNLKYRVGWVPSNRGKMNAPFTLPITDMGGNNYMDSTQYPGVVGLWLVMWDDLDLTKPLDSFTLNTTQPTYTSVTERVDLRSNGVAGVGHCRVLDFENIPGHTTASVNVSLVYAMGTQPTPNYDNLWIVAPGDWDIVDGKVVLDRSNPFVLSRSFVNRLGDNLECMRWLSATITSGNPVSFPYPEPMAKPTDENWGDLSFQTVRIGINAVGPIDPSVTPWVYSPNYGKPKMSGSTFPTTLADSITTTPAVGTHENHTFSDAATTPLMAGLEIQLNSEVCRILAVSGTTVTLYRGSNGTTPATHSPGVYQVYGRRPTTSLIPSSGIMANANTFQFTTSVPHGATSGHGFNPTGTFPTMTWTDGSNPPLLIRWTYVLGPNTIGTTWGPSSTPTGTKPVQTYAVDPSTHYSDMRYAAAYPFEAVCNITSQFPTCNLHLNFPTDACDDLIWTIARIILANLPAGRKVYLELANEPWNWAYAPNGYFTQAINTLALGGFQLQFNIMRSAEIWAIFETVFTAAGRGSEIFGLLNCQLGGAETAQYLDYAAANNIKVGAVANAPYMDLEATTLNANMVNAYDDEQAIDMFIHDFVYNPNTYNNWFNSTKNAISTYNSTTGNGCMYSVYEGAVSNPLPTDAALHVTNVMQRNHDVNYNPNFYIAELDYYAWLQTSGFHHLILSAFGRFWAPEAWATYHAFQQDHGRGDGSDFKFDNRTLKANPTSPQYKGATVNQDKYCVSVRGQAYLDWNSTDTAPRASLGCSARLGARVSQTQNTVAALSCGSICKGVQPSTHEGVASMLCRSDLTSTVKPTFRGMVITIQARGNKLSSIS